MPTCSGPEIETEVIPGESLEAERIDEKIDPLEAFITLSENKWRVAKATAIVASCAAVLVFALPSRFTATTKILPPQQNQSVAMAMSGQLAAMGPLAASAGKDLGLKNPSEVYVGMLRSRTVEDSLVYRFELMKAYGERRSSDAREELEKASTISLGKDGMISISVEDKNPKRSALLANAYVSELQKLTQNVALTEAGQRRIFFEQQVKLAGDSLAAAEQDLKETQQKTGLFQLDGQSKAIIESVVQLRSQIAAKEVELRTIRSYATEQNADVALVYQELAGLRSELSKLEKQQTSVDGGVQIPTGNVPQAGLEYLRRLRNLKHAEGVYESLARQLEAARVDEAK
jgi:tyrosine-protein kinase Etk/Wzc